jgi:hypothetical protein
MIPFFLFQAAGGSSARQPATMVLEFPEPHIAILKPMKGSLEVAHRFKLRLRLIAFAAMSWAISMGLLLYSSHHLNEQPIVFLLFTGIVGIVLMVLALIIMLIDNVTGIVGFVKGIAMAIGERFAGKIVFDHQQGTILRDARKLDPIWQGGLRLRDVASLELSTTSVQGMTCFALDMVMSRPQGEKVRLVAHGNRDAMRADAAELARFLNIPLADRTV